MTDDEIFAAAFDLPPEKRSEFLLDACRSDPAQLDRLRELLSAHGEADGFLRGPAVSRDAPLSAERPGEKIGPYKLVQRIGEGGVGVVWMAQQEQPLRRMVALKIIKLGMDTEAVVARFEAERHALALMEHPNIARVFDAGVTASGRPYFVMELVRGTPITRYCDDHALTTQERLVLFIAVCDAVQHAHQKGVIHRDLKPSNILVTENGGRAVPKVIDFGIAKATQGRLGDATIFTAFEQFVGTPVYMSPEQADMTSLDVDTRADIYSLGVLLFELLTGRTPVDAKTILEGGYRDLSRRIREAEPQRPSQRVATLNAETRATVAKSRRTAPSDLALVLRGDLDWIVMRCLEKDRARRYESASALALDLQRHQRDEPILARPPSALYLGQKLFRRHRVAAIAALASIVVLVAGGTFSVWQAVRATRAEHEQARLRGVEKDLLRASEQKEQAARRRAYAADMKLAQQALTNDNLGLARRLLERQRPAAGEIDLRGWEWRYLWLMGRNEAVGELTRRAHPVTSLSVSTDQNWVAVGEGESGGLAVFNLRTRQEIKLPAGNGSVQAVFSPVEPILAIAYGAGRDAEGMSRVQLWSAATREVIAEWNANGPVRFSRDGRTLLTGSVRRGGPLQKWNTKGEPLGEVPSSGGGMFAVSDDLQLIAREVSRGARGTVQVVDASDGRELRSFEVSEESVTAIAFSPNGRLLAAAGGATVPLIRVWDLATGALRATFRGHRTYVTALVFWPDGQTLASASTDQTVRVWNFSHDDPLRVLRGHELEVRSLALVGDGTTLVSGAKDGAVYLWDTAAPEPRRRHRIEDVANWVFSPDSKTVAVLDTEGVVTTYRAPDFVGREEKLRIGRADFGPGSAGQGPPPPVAGGRGGGRPGGRTVFAANAPLLAVAERDGVVRVYNWQSGQVLRELATGGAQASLIGFGAGGSTLLLASGDGAGERARLQIWNFAGTGQPSTSPAMVERAGRYALSANGRFVAGRTTDGMQSIIDVTTGVERRVPVPASNTSLPSFSSDARLLALPNTAGWAKIWDVERNEPVGELTGFVLGVHGAVFSQDGRRILVGSGAGEAVSIWSSEGFEPLVTLPAEGSVFTSVALSSDGNIVGARNGAGQLHLWVAPSIVETDRADKATQR